MKGAEFAQLKAFVAVAECCNFRRAAGQLGVAPSTLSQAIAQLEDRLEVRLLNRTTRSVRPTPAGELLLSRLLPIMRDLDSSVDQVSSLGGLVSGRIRLVSSRAGARLALAPLLAAFGPAHPEIDLNITVDDAITNIVDHDFDAGIRVGNLLEKDMVALPLTPAQPVSVVAAPAYIARHGEPDSVQALRDHHCVRTQHPTTRVVFPWRLRDGKQNVEFLPSGNLTVGDEALALDCVLSGTGIGYMLDADIQQYIDSGTLLRLLPGTTEPLPGFHIYYVRSRHMPGALRQFIDFIKASRDWQAIVRS
ncbi:MAG: LysR family transcriptional regulator [Spongiibacteraceae bacterium]|jgi:DNA-binding transcriptional LysR family regulator|nr:LysR family transcriptional regulator [Spongiibacteraceae bacterium]